MWFSFSAKITLYDIEQILILCQNNSLYDIEQILIKRVLVLSENKIKTLYK